MLNEILYIIRNISIIVIGYLSFIQGAYLKNIPVNLDQPNGIAMTCLSSGDEYYIRLHNHENFTFIQSQEDGYYYYAHSVDGQVVPTIYRADQPIPSTINSTTRFFSIMLL